MISEVITKLVERANLTEDECTQSMQEIMSGSASPVKISAFLTALRMKGETVDEMYACAKVMRDKAVPVRAPEGAMDTCGSGGDGSGTFNISTAAALVVASCGVPVAKHGAGAISSKCGSADVLEALGIPTKPSVAEIERNIAGTKFAFLYAPNFHPATKNVLPVRKELGIRTVFNVLGPLTNPTKPSYQVMGIADGSLTEKFAQVFQKLGTKRALVVNGTNLDELSICGVSYVSELNGNKIDNYTVSPEDFGITCASLSDLRGGDAKTNAKIITNVLSDGCSPAFDAVVLNAGAALYVCGKSSSISDGVELARRSISSGDAARKLDELRGDVGGL